MFIHLAHTWYLSCSSFRSKPPRHLHVVSAYACDLVGLTTDAISLLGLCSFFKMNDEQLRYYVGKLIKYKNFITCKRKLRQMLKQQTRMFDSRFNNQSKLLRINMFLNDLTSFLGHDVHMLFPED